ncbi:hypothetical protein GSI_05039 [Ganoderma sinense ZZ0214-1]|uniref:Uncharacterized protein n=1 Tax=Ganoderma sinense ZZ0214-1 TaxID=1077348 RepID=A0A2G8SGP4_9APHY|nr:hypothetical protein GSI_05039 [Ganoderma sinense ZZ0214-1]
MPRRGRCLSLGQTLRGQFARREILVRSQLRQEMDATLVSMSGRSTASMSWTLRAYLKNVFFLLGIKLIWVPDILFTNLSNLTGLAVIMRIFSLWRSGAIRFEWVTAAEREAAMRDPLSAAPGPLHLGMPARFIRSDIGARQERPVTNPLGLPYRYERNGPKSERVVSDSAEAAAEAEVREAKERAAGGGLNLV